MSAMQFWGVEVKAGQPLKVETTAPYLIHLSQAALEPKKEKSNDSILLSAKVGDKKIVLGTLSSDKFPQLSFDLIFEHDFELSHNGKTGSVHLCGYETLAYNNDDSEDMSGDEFDDESEDEELPVANGKVEPQVEKVKPATAKAKAKASEAKVAASKPKENAKPSKNVLPANVESDEDDSDDEDDSEDDSMDGSSDEEGMSVDDEDDDGKSEDEETPKKKVETKKRPNESATKTPVSSKKAKSNTPQKSDGKKAAHVSTPHPAKKEGKASASGKQTPKSGGQFSCKSCDKGFGSDGALRAHSQAKHSAAK